jgi:hypothetical protein
VSRREHPEREQEFFAEVKRNSCNAEARSIRGAGLADVTCEREAKCTTRRLKERWRSSMSEGKVGRRGKGKEGAWKDREGRAQYM